MNRKRARTQNAPSKALVMTPEQAREFTSFSLDNVALVESALAANCNCSAYLDVFTFNRWKAQGFIVRRGQHGIKIPVVKTYDRKPADTGQDEGNDAASNLQVATYLSAAYVFCRCQVDALPQKGAIA